MAATRVLYRIHASQATLRFPGNVESSSYDFCYVAKHSVITRFDSTVPYS